MKVIIFGNAGSGKSTLARKLIGKEAAALLSLDKVAFQSGTERRPLQDSIMDMQDFISDNESWIIEGCYSDILESAVNLCEELYFLNPGIDACIAHCRSRPWEPEKFSSPEEQHKHLDNLIDWIVSYKTRSDEYGLDRHRALFESFRGRKYEFKDPREYESV